MVDAPAVLVVAAVFEGTREKYGARGRRYVHMDVGHAAENVYLQAAALDLGTTVVGAFRDDAVSAIVGLEPVPVGLMPG